MKEHSLREKCPNTELFLVRIWTLHAVINWYQKDIFLKTFM